MVIYFIRQWKVLDGYIVGVWVSKNIYVDQLILKSLLYIQMWTSNRQLQIKARIKGILDFRLKI